MNHAIPPFCPNCFKPSQTPKCVSCQFDVTDYPKNPHHLPLFSALKGYILGRVLEESPFSITYIAKKKGQKTLFSIKEYYPKPLSIRCPTALNLKVKSTPEIKSTFAIYLKRFMAEAHLLDACQRYPGIKGVVRYVNLVQQNGTLYLITEYIQGYSLATLASKNDHKLAESHLKQWLPSLLDTLAALHQQQCYHQNISLKNIFLPDEKSPIKTPVLMGFDLYRQIKTPFFKTNPDYAPEQFARHSKTVIDARTDLYLLGAALFQCLNGIKIPTLKQRLKNPRLIFSNTTLDPLLKKTINQCLALSKERRPQNIEALKILLAPFLSPQEPTPAPIKIAEDSECKKPQYLWQQTKALDNIEAYKKYLQDHPDGEQKEIAIEAIKRLELEQRLTSLVENIQQSSPIPQISSNLLLSQTQDRLSDDDFAPAMVLLPSGGFLMGTAKTKKESFENEKQHSIEIKSSFYISQYPVTFAEYDLFCRENNLIYQSNLSSVTFIEEKNRHPVTNVSWFDAVSYCNWLSEKTGKHYKLPTEAEWEYACRASSQSAYYFGTDLQKLKDYAWYQKNSNGESHPVGLKRPNIWGLYDMHGNVWEWTNTEDPENYAKESLINKSNYPIVRGGSWDDLPWWLRSAYRNGWDATYRSNDLGFRIAKTY
ncbi:MAG: SUMF1/EgtB/PvdO family nonheme iron enzyme [Methylococcales bacterium]|nr:SUMF1/EgtB/PvdO family nonheme iron enzyme [Methylococcales bacterium]